LKLSFLAHDLRTFEGSHNAQARLSKSTVPNNVGPPYLTESEAKKALSTPLHAFRPVARNPKQRSDGDDSKTLSEFLDQRLRVIIENRRAKTDREGSEVPDFVLCTSHDLAPLLQAALGLERRFDGAKDFKKAYKLWDKSSGQG
jgi:hypothetical protein